MLPIVAVLVALGSVLLFQNCGPNPPSTAPPACSLSAPAQAGRVQTSHAIYDGNLNAGIYSFKKIAYAAPPVGALRWQAPQDPACQSEPVQASTFPPACPQKETQDKVAVFVGNEDCLYLNVWAPQDMTLSRPVLVFIHGGGNQQGSTAHQVFGAYLHDGQKMAEKTNAVVVTLQYRVGALGYLVDEALASASGNLGNYGLRDQNKALRWVQNNISRFGGDPSRVLLFGESAGAVNTCMQVASPLSGGLFSAAAIESGACLANSLSQAQQTAQDFLTKVGCTQGDTSQRATCLRNLSSEAIVNNSIADGGPLDGGVVNTPWGPVVDSVGDTAQRFLPEEPLTWMAKGLHNKVPVIVGSNGQEMMPLLPLQVTELMVRALAKQFEPYNDDLLALYNEADPKVNYEAMATDSQFTCNARRSLRALRQGLSPALYQYVFNQPLPGLVSWGAFHGAELFFLFQKLDEITTKSQVVQADRDLASLLLNKWLNFATSKNPNGPLTTSLNWDPFGTTENYLEFSHSSKKGTRFRQAKCDLWDTIKENLK